MKEKSFTVRRTIQRTPWDVYEFLADPEMQYQWRERHAGQGAIEEAEPYTRVSYSDRLVFEIEPDGSHTMLTMTKTHVGTGMLGEMALKLRSAKHHEEDLMTILMRIDSALTYGGI